MVTAIVCARGTGHFATTSNQFLPGYRGDKKEQRVVLALAGAITKSVHMGFAEPFCLHMR